MFKLKQITDIEWNVKTHNRLANKYERMHGEIYNDREQTRLKSELNVALSHIRTSNPIKLALDFGCGAGNLTAQLMSLGCEVLASDVSQGFLNLIASRTYQTKVETIKLNGLDLSNITDASVDIVATYSVLHHVPDYLGILKEFMRVLRPGGVIFIDHELSEEFWLQSQIYLDFESKMKKYTPINYQKYFSIGNYYDWIIRRFVNPRYHREGDIHVFEDDHVEWSRVIDSLFAAGAEVVVNKSYLLFRRNYEVAIYDAYKEITADMHLLVVRKPI